MLWLAIWLLGYRFLHPHWALAERWLLLSGATLTVIWWRVRQNLALNHHPGDNRLLRELGPGNQVSLFRGLLLGLLAGFLFSPWPQGALAWVIAGLYTVVSIADALDGFIARRRNQVTTLGQWLDLEFDGLGVAIISLLAVGYGQLPAWFLSVGLARYMFVLGLKWRQYRGEIIYDMQPSNHRRILAGMLMGMMTVVLWPIVPAAMSHVAAIIIGVPVLLGFLRDWLFVSGRLSEENDVYRQVQHLAYLLLARWLPFVWRLLLIVAMAGILSTVNRWYQPAAWEALLQSWGVPGASYLTSLLVFTAVAGTIFAGLGVLGRVAAIALLFPIGFDISTQDLTWQNSLALACTLLIAFFGSGILSLWRPEETLIIQHESRPNGQSPDTDGKTSA